MRAEKVLFAAPARGCRRRAFPKRRFRPGLSTYLNEKELESEGEWYWGMVGGPTRAGLIFGAKGMEVAHGGAPHDATSIGLGDPPAA